MPPWLEQQLALIAPRVVVTVGNFATRTLLGTKEGITKLRGRSYPYGAGVLVPTFHPAAVLRGGAQQMAQMRADLVRAKQALSASVGDGRAGRAAAARPSRPRPPAADAPPDEIRLFD